MNQYHLPPKRVRVLIFLHELMWRLEQLSGRILRRVWEDDADDPPAWIRIPHSWFLGRRYDLQHMINRCGYTTYGNKT